MIVKGKYEHGNAVMSVTPELKDDLDIMLCAPSYTIRRRLHFNVHHVTQCKWLLCCPIHFLGYLFLLGLGGSGGLHFGLVDSQSQGTYRLTIVHTHFHN